MWRAKYRRFAVWSALYLVFPKKKDRRRGTKWPVIDGVRYYDYGNPEGREICISLPAWKRRKLEVFERDKGICQTAALINHQPHPIDINDDGWTADHKTRRGSGGWKRNDNRSNLRLTCDFCHSELHNSGRHE